VFNPEEAEICKRRGHSEYPDEKRWSECKWCRTFYREVRTVEEREDEPPAKEHPRPRPTINGNPEDAGICKRRGHSRRPDELWNQCTWCGQWFRYVSSLEERQEIPAEVQAERDLQAALDKQLEEAKENLDKLRKLRKDQEVPASSDNE
jgi:hypothetical protein